ncbi:MAG: DUF692 domain-containing protein [Candidatus Oxydemutatoraceae bacterium WSBS_2016_MAG_OTU14]
MPSDPAHNFVHGCGLGLRRSLLDEFETYPEVVSFVEVAPENWIGLGGTFRKRFDKLIERYPLLVHGLSLSLGSPAPLDTKFLGEVKNFLDQTNARFYSEHLSYCSDEGHLYDLIPIPFTEDAADYVAGRIRQTQDILERTIAVENTSAYLALGQEMSEIDFLKRVLEKADCKLLLDVNNIYVNSVNFRFDPFEYLKSIPAERIAYIHIAGHQKEADDLLVDTHGNSVIEPVWNLLEKAYELFGPIPTLLERDFNMPPFVDLLNELHRIKGYQHQVELQQVV